MSELKKCPFCGGEARWATKHKHWIECEVCGVEGIYSENSEDCIEAWNTRKPVERILERLEEACYWTPSTYDIDGYCNDDSEEVIDLYKAIEIIKEEVG